MHIIKHRGTLADWKALAQGSSTVSALIRKETNYFYEWLFDEQVQMDLAFLVFEKNIYLITD